MNSKSTMKRAVYPAIFVAIFVSIGYLFFCLSPTLHFNRSNLLVSNSFNSTTLLSTNATTPTNSPTEPILEVTDSTFMDVCGKGRQFLIEFYSPDCHFCVDFAPIYREIAEEVQRDPALASCVTLGKLDMREQRHFFDQYHLHGIPTLLMFGADSDCVEAEPFEYTGERNKENILRGIRERCLPPPAPTNSPTEPILEVTDSTFMDVCGKGRQFLIEFYSPDCHFCVDFAPIYREIAEEVQRDPALASCVTLGKLDMREQRHFFDQYHLHGIPTLLMFGADSDCVEAEPFEYTGERNKENILRGIRERCLPPPAPTNSPTEPILEVTDSTFMDVCGKGRQFLIEFYSPDCHFCVDFAPIYREIAEEVQRDPALASCVTLGKLDMREQRHFFDQYHLHGIPTLLMFGADSDCVEAEPFEYTGERNKENILRGIRERCLPPPTPTNSPTEPILEVTDSTFMDVCGKGRQFLIEFYSPDCHFCVDFAPIYREIAEEVQRDPALASCVTLGKLDMREQRHFFDQYHLHGIPTLLMFGADSDCVEAEPFEYTGERNKENILRGIRERCLPPPAPTNSPTEPILEVTDSTFMDVCGKGRQFLIEFYSPDCHFCVDFAPIYREIAEEVQRDPALASCVTLGKLDMREQRHFFDQYHLHGIPTLLMFGADSDCVEAEPFEYTGERNKENILRGIRERCNA